MWRRKIVQVITRDDINKPTKGVPGLPTEADVGKLVYHEWSDDPRDKRLFYTLENDDQRDLRLDKIKNLKTISPEKIKESLELVAKSQAKHREIIDKLEELKYSLMYHTKCEEKSDDQESQER